MDISKMKRVFIDRRTRILKREPPTSSTSQPTVHEIVIFINIIFGNEYFIQINSNSQCAVLPNCEYLFLYFLFQIYSKLCSTSCLERLYVCLV